MELNHSLRRIKLHDIFHCTWLLPLYTTVVGHLSSNSFMIVQNVHLTLDYLFMLVLCFVLGTFKLQAEKRKTRSEYKDAVQLTN